MTHKKALMRSIPDLDNLKICIIGLGYVGFPLARLFATKYPTVGFDINPQRVGELNDGHDSRLEVSDKLVAEALTRNNLLLTSDIADMMDCNFYIVAVPTPVSEKNVPDLKPLLGASELVGKVLSEGDIVVYESTVYPGVTEEMCVPVLERVSGLRFNEGFYCGYSPERVNPGDKLHTVETIRKVTSGSTPEVADLIDKIYGSVLINGTFKASSIKVAEASKIIENCQRDVNIAFFNEIAKILNAIGLDTEEVTEAAASKWNFIRMKPGLVGGHCISVDPYYLIQKAREHDINPELLVSARSTNENMGEYVARQVIDLMNRKGILVKDADVLIMGFTFKENCPDTRNTKVVGIHDVLKEYTSNIDVVDPLADAKDVADVYGIGLKKWEADGRQDKKYDAVILAVAHREFSGLDVRGLLKDAERGVVYDVKGVLPKKQTDGRL